MTNEEKAEYAKRFLETLDEIKPDKSTRYSYSELGGGQLLADLVEPMARYVPERKKWYVYGDGVWKPDTGALEIMELCKVLATAISVYALGIQGDKGDQYRKYAGKWLSRHYRKTIVEDAASVYPLSAALFDQKPALFNCQNGTVNLDTGTLQPHDPSDFLTIMSGIRYDPTAKSDRWIRFIREVTQEDRDKAAYLQKALGYGLTGEALEECFFILYGPTTRNGKGTLMETYMKLQGGYGRTARTETITQRQHTNGSGPSEDLARLAGARAVNISEPEKQMVLSSALVKTLTGRDTINARFLNENSFEFVPQFKLFINTNHLPRVTDLTLFSSGRVKVIPFERHFEEQEQDKALKQKLARQSSLSGIFNWCLKGLEMFRDMGGLAAPPSVQAAIDQYRRDNDKIARFIEDAMEKDPAGEIRTEDAYQRYQTWCYANGQRPEAMPGFNAAIREHTEIKRKRPAGSGRDAAKQTLILGFRWAVGQVWAGEKYPK